VKSLRDSVETKRLGVFAPERSDTSRPATAGKSAWAVGALALGATAIGALAIGAVAVGRLGVGRARIRRLEIDELVVRKLHVIEDLQAPPKPTSDDGV